MKIKIIAFALLVTTTGCQCLKCDPEVKDNTPQLNPDKGRFFDLLHIGNNIAYKSTTIKDYIIKEEC